MGKTPCRRGLNVRLRECMKAYSLKQESKLQQNNVRDVWSGMNAITGLKMKGNRAEGNLDRANKLNPRRVNSLGSFSR